MYLTVWFQCLALVTASGARHSVCAQATTPSTGAVHTLTGKMADLDTVGNSAGSGMDGRVWQQIDFQFDDVSDGTDLFRHGFADIDFEDDGTKLLSSVDCLQVLDMDGYNLALERAWVSVEPRNQLSFPWEKGIWAGIFQTESRASSCTFPQFSRLPVVAMPGSTVAQERTAKKPRVEPTCGSWQQVVVNSDIGSWQESHEAKLDVALKRWHDVVILFPAKYPLVGQLGECATVADQLRVMKDVLGSKSPHTLLKRVNSFIRYLTFLQSKNVVAPGSETLFYAFLCEQRDLGAPQSRLAATVEAVRFVEHVLGFEITQDLLSRRCLGSAKMVGPGPNKQASPLKVEELKVLHAVLSSTDYDIWDRNMAGAYLCCVYSRSRWSDMQHTNLLLADPDEDKPVYVELSITDYKTKGANAWRGGLLSAVAPAVGVTEDNWAAAWLGVREQIQAPLSKGFALMPAPSCDGTASLRPLSTAEVGKWINMMLDRAGLDLHERRITSHSAKATMLSYLAKYGAELGVREILGAHVSHLRSVIRYSRDALAAPLRTLDDMLKMIRESRFVPDATRSGYFAPGWQHVDPMSVYILSDEEDVKQEPDMEALSEVESPDTGSSSDEDAVEGAHCARQVVLPKAPDGFKLVQHTKSRMLHLLSQDRQKIFECGRAVGDNHEVAKDAQLRWDTPCCGRCWRSAGQALGPRLV